MLPSVSLALAPVVVAIVAILGGRPHDHGPHLGLGGAGGHQGCDEKKDTHRVILRHRAAAGLVQIT
jgi:hypothetical protein